MEITCLVGAVAREGAREKGAMPDCGSKHFASKGASSQQNKDNIGQRIALSLERRCKDLPRLFPLSVSPAVAMLLPPSLGATVDKMGNRRKMAWRERDKRGRAIRSKEA